jgi:hypothetical protein
MKLWRVLSLAALVWLVALVPDGEAQRFRYMDASGNIHFVETINDVPRQYRQQIVPPTPTPVLDARQKKELQRAKERELRERQRQIDNKKRELERTRRAIERDQKSHASKLGGVVAEPAPAAKPVAREDQIEVIR